MPMCINTQLNVGVELCEAPWSSLYVKFSLFQYSVLLTLAALVSTDCQIQLPSSGSQTLLLDPTSLLYELETLLTVNWSNHRTHVASGCQGTTEPHCLMSSVPQNIMSCSVSMCWLFQAGG